MPYDKKAVHFGGGAIGRGFVGQFLHNSGYELIFVDVVDSVVSELQNTPEYTVTEISVEGEKEYTIDHFGAINSKTDEPAVVEAIATADTVTCAVGPNVLKFIAPVIAKGIEARKVSHPLAVIACENAIRATDTLAGFIKEKLNPETLQSLDDTVRFANSAVDRIVPTQAPNSGLNIRIEHYSEWCVESGPFKGMQKPPVIEGVHFVSDLTPYIERKLFTVNTAHATAAYFGILAGKSFIHQAMADENVLAKVQAALRETAHLIVTKHKIPEKEQGTYVHKIITRISSPLLEDNVERVGRAPLRKLSRNERFIGPASQLIELGTTPSGLLEAIEAAFKFQNIPGDEESVQLAQILKEHSPADVVSKVTGLEPSHALFEHIVPIVQKVQSQN